MRSQEGKRNKNCSETHAIKGGGGGGGGGADCAITKTCLTMSTHASKTN